MKKLLYLMIAAAGAGIVSCSDQNDVVKDLYDEIDNTPYAANVDYTLTAADYGTISTAAAAAATTDDEKALAAAVKSTSSLNSFAAADRFAPAALATAFPALRQGSTAQLSYDFTADRPAYLATLAASSAKLLIGQDFTDAATGDAFASAGWTQFDASGAGVWKVAAYGGNNYVEVTSFGDPKEKNEVFLVSPAVDLSGVEFPAITFDAELRYPVAGQDYLRVLIATDYDAEAKTATWTDITENFSLPTAQTNALANVGAMKLEAYKGKSVNVAFEYLGDDTATPALTTTLRIDNIRFLDDSSVPGAAYIDNGDGWEIYADGISLTADDYKAMGLTSLNASQAPDYLPAFLAQKFPYAQQGAIKAVVYSGGTDEYAFESGVWTPTAAPTTRTEQFVYADNGWMFDPTVNHTMTSADQQIAVTAALADPATSMYTNLGRTNEEWYYGFNAFYNNVSFNLSAGNSSRAMVASSVANDTELHALDGKPAEQAALLWKRLVEKGMPLYLKNRWPMAVTDVQGVEVLYKIGVAVFYPDGVTSATVTYTLEYKVATDGSASTPATFEYVSGAPAEFYK
ncbi:MAG: DUF5017 domain-containing protein [Alistipes sp.]|jgi:hypothetical protein|nr:DUF5017 domain-containing protein [Alistipes sp.]